MKDLGLAILRIIPSALLIVHGFGKFRMVVAGSFDYPNDPVGIGTTGTLFLLTIGEFLAPIFLILGFKTRIAAIVVGITMFINAFLIHNAAKFPITQGAENALLFLTCFAAVYMLGPGVHSMDKK